MNRREFGRLGIAASAGLAARIGWTADFDYPWKLGIITDEVDADLGRVLSSFYPKYPIHWAEIRNAKLDGKSKYVYRTATPPQLKELRKQLDGAGAKMSVLDTAIYKIPLPGTQAVKEEATELNPSEGEYSRQMDDLKRASEAARVLGTNKLRIFDFNRVPDPEATFNRRVEELNKALEVAKQQDVVLLLENEHSCNSGTASAAAKILKAVPDRRLALNWDPGNCYEAGEEPFPKGWDQLDHSRIEHVHIKDAKGKTWQPVGKGEIDFRGQFAALKKMKYAGTMSLETHYQNAAKDKFASSVESMDGLVQVLKEV